MSEPTTTECAPDIQITSFQSHHQYQAKRLILAGLVEHWGWLDLDRNPDLEDIAQSYAAGEFLCALSKGQLIGTGAILPRSPEVSEIVRMSVDRTVRRKGVGIRILDRLVKQAQRWRCKQVILETTKDWQGTIAFYEKYGFRQTRCIDEDLYLALDLTMEQDQ